MTLSLPAGVTLYFARHGQTQANLAARYPGHRETRLTALGEQQARDIGNIVKREAGARPALDFVSSPLQRAQATMRLAREELGLAAGGFATDPRLLEIDHGDWTGLTDAETETRDPAFYRQRSSDRWNVALPNGESYADLAARVAAWLAGLRGDTLAVTHGAVTQVLRGLCGGMAPADMAALDEPQGVVFRARGTIVERLEAN